VRSSPGAIPSSPHGRALAVRSARGPFALPVVGRRARRWLVLARAAPLLVVVVLCLGLVALAAHQSSFLSPTASSLSYPSWMAGPFAGLWPSAFPDTLTLEWLVSGALGLMCLAYLLAVRFAPHIDPRWVLASILAVHLIFLLAPPLEYTDVFNYINYGRMGVIHHMNPYVSLPAVEPHSDPAYGLSNWHYLRSPYGPLFTLLTYALVPLGVPASFWALKIIVGACSLALLALVWRFARLLGRSPAQAVAVVGLNPIVLVWGLGGVHTDFIMVFLILAAMYLLLAPRLRGASIRPLGHRAPAGGLVAHELAAGALLIGAIGIKASAAIFLPLAIAIAPRRRALLAGMAGTGAVLILVGLLAFGPQLGGVRAQSTLVSPEGLPNLLGLLLGLGGATSALRGVLAGVAAVAIIYAAARARRRPLDAMHYGCASAVALVFTLGWSAPWYVLWALPFAAVVAGNRWRATLMLYTVYALIASSPNIADFENVLHFHPRSGRIGMQEQHNFEHLAAQ
jgi:hypothetical protein